MASSVCFIISAIDNAQKIIGTEKSREKLDLINCVFIMIAILVTIIGIMIMIILKLVQCIKKLKSEKQYKKLEPNPAASKTLQSSEAGKQPLNQVAPKSQTPLIDDNDDFLQKGAVSKPKVEKNEFEDDFLAGNQHNKEELGDDAF